MAVNIRGNFGSNPRGKGIGGVGVENYPAGLGWVSVVASAANDVGVVSISSLLSQGLNMGIFFQSAVNATVEFTLAPLAAAMSTDPGVNQQAMWGSALSLTPGVIGKADVIFTACRITFTAPGEVYIGAI